MSTRTRFRVLLGVMSTILAIFTIIILSAHDEFGGEKLFNSALLTVLYIFDGVLYTIQVIALVLAFILLFRLRNMIKASPSIITGESTNEARQNDQASEE